MLSRAARSGGAIATAIVVVLGASVVTAQSPPGSAGAKAAAKCQQTIVKVNAKFLSQRVKRLATCSNAVLGCVQNQPGVAACVAKATAKCRKQLGTPEVPDVAAAKLEAAVVKACGGLPVGDLLAVGGLGFGDTAAACAAVGVAPVASATDVARCLQRLHGSLSEETFAAEVPRAAELAGLGGVSALVVPDLPPFAGCGDCAVPGGQAVAACGAAIAKAGSAFLGKARSGLDKCAAGLVGCAQSKPGDAGCLTKAKATCAKLPPTLAKGRTALLAALTKKCGGTLAFATLDQPSGINLGALACECQQVGVAPVASLDDYALCLTRQHECRLAATLPSVVPSLDGLLASQSLAVGDLLCAPPAASVAIAGSHARAPRGFFGSIGKFVKSVSPGTLKPSSSPFATRGTGRRVGRPSFAGCFAAPGRSCAFRFPITKRPASLQKARGVPPSPPALIIGVQRADGELADQHFEIDLGDTSVDQEVEVTLTYADDLASCDFDLALSVAEEGEVSTYTTVEQTPHAVPDNDACGAAQPITTPAFSQVLDVTAATAIVGEPAPVCNPGGLSNTVWYQFTAPASGLFTADTFGSDFDSAIAVWTGTCGAPVLRTCANDSGGTLQSKVAMPVVQGTTYLIQVGVNGDPADSSTLHFAFRFEQAGAPPVSSNLESVLVEINSNAICAGTSSAFRLSLDYEDPDGDVLPTTASAEVSAHFEPSDVVSNFTVFPVDLTGDGFSGTASFIVCARFSADTSVETTVRLADLAGAGNAVTTTIARPPGAN